MRKGQVEKQVNCTEQYNNYHIFTKSVSVFNGFVRGGYIVIYENKLYAKKKKEFDFYENSSNLRKI